MGRIRPTDYIRADLAALEKLRADGCAPMLTAPNRYRRLVADVEPLLDRAEAAEAEAVRLRTELLLFKPEPMSQNCRDGKHGGAGSERCHGCDCLCHTFEADVERAELARVLVSNTLWSHISELHGDLAALRGVEEAPKRYDQCDQTCTTDCGHCKGNGPPPPPPLRGDPLRPSACADWWIGT
jgi:hypothetical protein